MADANWDVINAQKRLDILKGQTANQAWNAVLNKVETIPDKSILKEYEKLYNFLLEQNIKMILGKEGDKIPEKTIKADQLKNTEETKLVEIGAAWKDKKFPDLKLNCKQNDSDSYISVEIEKLEKTEDGYIYETDQEKLILREIPEEKRTNPRMPYYRIFKEEKK